MLRIADGSAVLKQTGKEYLVVERGASVARLVSKGVECILNQCWKRECVF